MLQYLHLNWWSELKEWRVEEGAMPSLRHLKIENCQSLKSVPDGLRFFTNLQELEIKRMLKSFNKRLREGGLDFEKVKHVPSVVIR